MILRTCAFLLLSALTGCGEYPRDPQGTLDRVRSEGSFRVGLVAPLEAVGLDSKALALLQRVGSASGAAPMLERGDAEPLLDRLERGELDLVIGRFHAKTPWRRLVSFSPPLRVEMQGRTEIRLVAAMRNGENGWISLVEREARNAAPEAQ